ncbi:MAG: hypothetical protein ACRC4W_00710 [Treponemataceae bacterium]
MKKILIILASTLLLACMSVSCENAANSNLNLQDGDKYTNTDTGELFTFDPLGSKGWFYFKHAAILDPIWGKYTITETTVTFTISDTEKEIARGEGTLGDTTLIITKAAIYTNNGTDHTLIPAGDYTKK